MKTLLVGTIFLLTVSPAHAVTIWALWRLDLGDHAPPVAFILRVTSPSGAPVPPAMVIPWQQCPLPGKPAGTYCAPIGCPAPGIYDAEVRAQYTDVVSAPSNIFRCTLIPPGGCQCVDTLLVPVAVAPLPVLSMPRPVVLSTIPPPRPQRTAEGLGLLPIGPLPAIPQVPAIPVGLEA